MGLCTSQQKRTYSSKRQSQSTYHKTQEVSTQQTKKSFRNQRTDFKVAPNIFVSLKRGDISSFYTVDQVLGEGTYGRVSLVTQKQTGIKRAMKQIQKDKILLSQKDSMIQEVNILKDLDHPNIVNIFELYQDENYYYLVIEYLSGGELFERVRQRKNLNESLVANYMKQILNAVNYCHQRNVIHRDLKPENILFVTKYEDNLKVIDFGTAKQILQTTQLKQQTGTPYFLAPEVLNQNYNHKCDIWSCGIILYILLCGKPPFTGSDAKELFRNIKSGFVDFSGSEWLDISQEAKSFILKLLEVDPVKRVSAEQALKDPWIVSNQKVDKINQKNLENLSSFHNKSKLTSAILQFISTQVMTSKEKKELIEGFRAIDKNGDGKLSKSELTECYMNLYKDEIKCTQLVNKIFKTADVDGSGTLDYTEFVVAYSELQTLTAKEKLQTTFKLFDKDGNGTISKPELQEILGGLALQDNQWNSMFEELDINGDGEVTYEEFTQRLIRDT